MNDGLLKATLFPAGGGSYGVDREKTEKEQRTTIQIARWRTRWQEWRLCGSGEKQGEASVA